MDILNNNLRIIDVVFNYNVGLNFKVMKILQLYREGKEILATDGIMYVDGRFSLTKTKQVVRERNERFKTNFPHKVCDSFTLYSNGIGSPQSQIIKLD